MEFKKCARCGNFFASEFDVCESCSLKDRMDVIKFKGYIEENFEEQVAEKGEFGQLAMRQHYVGKDENDIIRFIERVVLQGDDPMKESRRRFVEQYLIPPHGKTVTENTMDILLKAFC